MGEVVGNIERRRLRSPLSPRGRHHGCQGEIPVLFIMHAEASLPYTLSRGFQIVSLAHLVLAFAVATLRTGVW